MTTLARGDEITVHGRRLVHRYDRQTHLFAEEPDWVKTLCGQYGRLDGTPSEEIHRCRPCRDKTNSPEVVAARHQVAR